MTALEQKRALGHRAKAREWRRLAASTLEPSIAEQCYEYARDHDAAAEHFTEAVVAKELQEVTACSFSR